jgi:aminoglycoside phosphotransferase (APT) family kinase protein
VTADKTVDVRDEDRFDVAAVHDWLASRVDGLDGMPAVRRFPGGDEVVGVLLAAHRPAHR